MEDARGMEERIREIVATELVRLGAGDTAFSVEWPADMAHGDYAVNAALIASKILGKPPQEIAEGWQLRSNENWMRMQSE
jgi:arginyl-tRNA synthetase